MSNQLNLHPKHVFILSPRAKGSYLGVTPNNQLAFVAQPTEWRLDGMKLCLHDRSLYVDKNFNLVPEADAANIGMESGPQEHEIFLVHFGAALVFDQNRGFFWSPTEALPLTIQIKRPDFVQAPGAKVAFKPDAKNLAEVMLELQNTKAQLKACQNKPKPQKCTLS